MPASAPRVEDLLKPRLVRCLSSATDKAGILNVLAAEVSGVLAGLDPREIVYAVLEREKMGPMPLGKGLAFCHARMDKVPELTIAIAVCPAGVEGFTTPDGAPVKIVFLFLIPKQHSDLYLRAMASLLRQLSRAETLEQVLEAGSPEAVVALLGGDQCQLDLEAVSDLFAAVQDGGAEPSREILHRTPPAYLAELMEDLTPEARARFLGRMEATRAAQVVGGMHLTPAAAALRRMAPEAAANILGRLNTARAADLVQQFKPEAQSAVLKHMGVRGGRKIQAVLNYPPSTAGGIMTPDVLSVRQDASVADALKTVAGFPDRRQVDVYAVTTDGRLVGKCEIHDLLSAEPSLAVSEVMKREPESVQPEHDQEAIRHMVAREDIRSIPVVGAQGALLGVVTEDDILTVIEEEAGEDILAMAGSSEIVDPLYTPIATRIRLRLPWLLLTLGGELFIALVISKVFAPTLEKAVVLAAFIPAIMATGGNVGLQSTTMVIRSLGMGTLKPRHTARLVLGEVKLGLITGLGCGAIAAVVAYLINWSYPEVAKVSVSVFLAMMSATFATSLVGTLEPLILHKLKFDPATACGPFVTMFNDMFGSIVYLLIAMAMNFTPPAR